MRLVFLGAPGVGKGTQAKRLCRVHQVPHLATGDMLRAAISKGSAVGCEAKAYVDSGRLVPDDLVIRIVAARLTEDDARLGFILDGFPRTLEQADALAKMSAAMPLTGVLYFHLNEEVQIARLSGRRSCPQCYEIYHISNRPPKKEGHCDACGTPLLHRQDDRPDVIAQRLLAYKQETAPLIEYYTRLGCLHTLDAGGGVEDVERLIYQVLGSPSYAVL